VHGSHKAMYNKKDDYLQLKMLAGDINYGGWQWHNRNWLSQTIREDRWSKNEWQLPFSITSS